MWHIYILLSRRVRKTYVGSTNNLERRLNQHNKKLMKSTALFAPWDILQTENYPNEAAARAREKWLKTGAGRRFLKKIIEEKINNWAGSSTG